MKTRDLAFFERALAKEYTQVVDGKRVDFAAQLAELRAGHMRIESMEVRDLRAHVVGDAAMVSMTAEARGAYPGQPLAEPLRGIDVFVKRDGRWQAVYSDMATIKEQARPRRSTRSTSVSRGRREGQRPS